MRRHKAAADRVDRIREPSQVVRAGDGNRFVATSRNTNSLRKITSQRAGPARMLEFAQCFRLDLADALARDEECLTYFLQRMVGGHAEAETIRKNALFRRRGQGR